MLLPFPPDEISVIRVRLTSMNGVRGNCWRMQGREPFLKVNRQSRVEQIGHHQAIYEQGPDLRHEPDTCNPLTWLRAQCSPNKRKPSFTHPRLPIRYPGIRVSLALSLPL